MTAAEVETWIFPVEMIRVTRARAGRSRRSHALRRAERGYRSCDRPVRYNAKDIFLYTKQKLKYTSALLVTKSGVLF